MTGTAALPGRHHARGEDELHPHLLGGRGLQARAKHPVAATTKREEIAMTTMMTGTRARRKLGFAVLAAGVALSVGACGTSSGSAGSDTTTTANAAKTTTTAGSATTRPGPTSTTAPATKVTLGAPFYQDNFKDATKGWPVVDDAGQTLALYPTYATPIYAIKVKKPNTAVHPHPEFRSVLPTQLQDYAVTAKIQTSLSVGHRDGFGVTCRDLQGKRYDLTMQKATSPGEPSTWAINKFDGTKSTTLSHGSFQVEGSAFTITGACTGGQGGPAKLDLLVNDELVGETTDAAAPLTKGYAGVYADTTAGNSSYNVLNFATSTVTVS